jgi:hypothetical protein
MKELKQIYGSDNYKQGKANKYIGIAFLLDFLAVFTIELEKDNLYEWNVRLKKVIFLNISIVKCRNLTYIIIVG